ncbi:MAG: hypothetical protein IAE80_01830 [Anaerolinea sp.]|nr:hypothetical protein [Anaerolinea sp.]
MLRRKLLILLVLLVLVIPTVVQAQDGVSIDCDDGTSISNGVEFQLANLVAGETYRVTAIGLNGFDTVMAVVDGDGNGLCNDDAEDAEGYAVDLPTTGAVEASSLSSQITFENTSSSKRETAAFSVVVGGFGGASGEFVLIVEGMTLTEGEDEGYDPVGVGINDAMVASEVPLSVYMISASSALDPAIYMVNADGDIVEDADGNPVFCDDAGNEELCFNTGASLDGSSVTLSRGELQANDFDALLALPFGEDASGIYVNYLLTSYEQQGQGDYVVVFHAGVGEGAGGSGGSGGGLPPARGGQGGGGSGEIAGGVAVQCDNGTSFNNGVEVIISQMRSGFTYTATAVGINGFDPVLAVLDENRNGLCNDDDRNAASYSASLPTTGTVGASGLSSQVRFDQNSREAFADVSLVVGGFGDQTGEFLLILEGMAVTSGDNAGDPFLVQVTQPMVDSGVPLTVYMLTRGTSGVDPYIYMLDGNGDPLQDSDGNDVFCDDAGTTSCYGASVPLDNYTVTINTGTLPGWQYDSMLSLPLDAFNFTPDELNYLTYMMTSFGGSEGQYLLVFHVGTAE